MDHNRIGKLEMRLNRYTVFFIAASLLIILYKLVGLESSIDRLEVLKESLNYYKDVLSLSEQQIKLIKNLENNLKGVKSLRIYAITPTYWRLEQKAELTRISQTLALVPNVHWIVVEDAEEKTDLVRNLLSDSNLLYTHLNAKTPPFEKLQNREPKWKKHRGVEQRNAALTWLRANMDPGKDSGVVYFMDDDNTYSIKLFDEIAKVKKVGVWPVGLVGGMNAEAPIVNKETGKVTGYISGWKPDRPFAIDMAGFAINLNLILTKKDAFFSYKMEKGLQESEFLSYFTTKEELEPLASMCTKVYVWHTRTEKTVVRGTVPGLEV